MKLTSDIVKHLARLQGLELDDIRAQTIAARLGAVIEEIESIPDDRLAGIEPLPVFSPEAVQPDE